MLKTRVDPRNCKIPKFNLRLPPCVTAKMSKHKELREFFENMWDRMFGDLDQPSSTPSPSASPPWDPWELNPEFFAAMSRWTISHPESTLDRILDKLCIAIENGQPLLELIPDSPFPARGLIKGIIHLLQLGRVCDINRGRSYSSVPKSFP